MIVEFRKSIRQAKLSIHQLKQWLYQPNKAFYNLRIGQKLNLSFAVLVVLTFIVVGVFSFTGYQIRNKISNVQQIDFPLALSSAQAQSNLLTMVSLLRGYVATAESDLRNQYQAARQAFEADIEELNGLFENPNQTKSFLNKDSSKAHLSQLNEYYHEWSALPEQLFSLRDDTTQNQPALALLQEQGEIPIGTIVSRLNRMIDLQRQRSLSNRNVELLTVMTNFKNAFILRVAALRSYVATQGPTFRFEYGSQSQASQQAWEQLQSQLSQMTPEQQVEFEAATQAWAIFIPLPQALFDIVEGDRYRQDLYLLRTQADPLANQILNELAEIVDIEQKELSQQLDESLAQLSTAQWQISIMGLLSLALGLVLALVLKQLIANPINRLTQVATQVGSGDLTIEAIVESRDEVGKLALTFNQMTQHLRTSQSALADYNHNLEQKVILRTQELEEKNQQIQQTLTDLKKTQTQLVQTEKMSSLGQLVAGIAHEINNPVNFIHGNITPVEGYAKDLLEMIDQLAIAHPEIAQTIEKEAEAIDLDFLKTDLPKILSSMRMGTNRIREIVLSLRNFSRLDEADLKPVDLHEGCESTLLILQSRFKATVTRPEIKVVRRYGGLSKVECHAGQINQVLMNLIANAVDALECAIADPAWQSTRQQPTIILQTAMSDEHTAEIRVIDNALGIPDTVQQRLFEPFFTTKDVGKGTGMGLSISYQIITETHKGQLFCQSIVGKGTQFIIQIPIRP